MFVTININMKNPRNGQINITRAKIAGATSAELPV
jgi:hypothetical protein